MDYTKEYLIENLYKIPLIQLVHILSKMPIEERNYIMNHESVTNEYRDKMNICADEEAKKVREEVKKVQEEVQKVQEKIEKVSKLIDVVDILNINKLNEIEEIRHLNKQIENEISMYQTLNIQCGAI